MFRMATLHHSDWRRILLTVHELPGLHFNFKLFRPQSIFIVCLCNKHRVKSRSEAGKLCTTKVRCQSFNRLNHELSQTISVVLVYSSVHIDFSEIKERP